MKNLTFFWLNLTLLFEKLSRGSNGDLRETVETPWPQRLNLCDPTPDPTPPECKAARELHTVWSVKNHKISHLQATLLTLFSLDFHYFFQNFHFLAFTGFSWRRKTATRVESLTVFDG